MCSPATGSIRGQYKPPAATFSNARQMMADGVRVPVSSTRAATIP